MTDALISVVVEQLSTYVQKEVNLVVGVHEEVGKLTATLKLLQALLADAQKKQVNNSSLKVWLEELRDVIYAADDVLDEWHTRIQIGDGHVDDDDDVDVASGSNTRTKKVLSFLHPTCHCFKRVRVQYDISHKIKEIGQRLSQIADQRTQFGLVLSENQDEPPNPNQLTSSIIDASETKGRDVDKETIIDKLLGESGRQGVVSRSVHVISIVAMGGLGKTTLAKLVYNNPSVINAFEKRIWVGVSRPFDLPRIAKVIVRQVNGNVNISDVWEVLHQQLSNSLKGKRFLLVLDDVWTEAEADWEPLKLSLGGGAPGSRIIVTTRNDKVAMMMGSTHTHQLKGLLGKDSWFLLSRVALKGREEVEKFKQIGQQIINKCNGSPLAIQIVGSFLRQKRRVLEWKAVVDSDIWELDGIEDKFFPSLFMSFNSLPRISKQCFLYCAMFPKNTKMYKDVLVKLWMAQGFFGTHGMNKLEQIGGYHFDILAMGSFSRDFEKDSEGNIISCKMHDLVHDFAQFLTQGECQSVKEFGVDKVRHLWTSDPESSSVSEAKNLRTLIVYTDQDSRIPILLFDRLSYLRALDLSERSSLENLPAGVGKLLHLRYLNFSKTGLRELPESICNLYNLQTLNLNKCRELCKLPDRIGYLCNLRHLEIQKTKKLNSLPHEIKKLSSIRTLCKFTVGGPNDRSRIKDLQLLNNLEGSLKIDCLRRVKDANEVVQAGLNRKGGIHAFKLKFNLLANADLLETGCRLNINHELCEEDDVRTLMEIVLKNLEPHEDLEKLCIKYYPGKQFPDWMHDRSLLGNIVDMELLNCAYCTILPGLGKLASLKSLKILKMNSVKHIGHEFYGFGVGSASTMAFPKLTKLDMGDMENLKEWELPVSNNVKIMPNLSSLRLSSLKMLGSLPCFGKLESLEDVRLLDLPCVECVGPEFLGISLDDSGSSSASFPKLKELCISSMPNWEQWNIPSYQKGTTVIMPNLRRLAISDCKRLKELPDVSMFKSLKSLDLQDLPMWEGLEESEERRGMFHFLSFRFRSLYKYLKTLFMPSSSSSILQYLVINDCSRLQVVPRAMFSPTLRSLNVCDCPELKGPCLPPLLKYLSLEGDVGLFSRSLPLDKESVQHITSVRIVGHSSLPEGFNQLEALESLIFRDSGSLDFELKELQQFTRLEHLKIERCSPLQRQFQGEDWKNVLSHVSNIIIDRHEIKKDTDFQWT